MILKQIFARLKTDAELAALLNASAGDPKIYPGMAGAQCAAPFIVYRSLCPGAQADEVNRMETVSLEIFAPSFSVCVQAAERLTRLLTTADEAQLSGADGRRIYLGTLAGGSDFTDERGNYVRALTFQFSFIDSSL